jgi:Zn-dependent peptidase ImmA (M78 family)
VPVERLIKLRGARLMVRSLEDNVSGFVYREGEQPVIGINTKHALARQRFTMAHELGHLLLHHTNGIHVDERDFFLKFRASVPGAPYDQEEGEANLFAAELLMPRKFLEKDVAQLGEISLHDDGAVRRLARRYGVSVQAFLIRLTALGLLERAALA